jgi:hypothetical protein
MRTECLDCNKSLEDCTCIEDTIELPNQSLIEAAERYEKYSERFDNDESAIGNSETWGRRLVEDKQETLEEAAENHAKIFQFPFDCDPAETFIEGAKWMQEQNDTSKVTRVEVIQHSPPYNGRAFTKYNAKDVEIQFQDDGYTLKIFLK